MCRENTTWRYTEREKAGKPMTTEAEMWSQSKGGLGLPEAGRGKEVTASGGSEGLRPCQELGFGLLACRRGWKTSSLLSVVSSHRVCGPLLRQPQQFKLIPVLDIVGIEFGDEGLGIDLNYKKLSQASLSWERALSWPLGQFKSTSCLSPCIL